MNAFETELGLINPLAKAVDDMGWLLPTDIQSEAIPQILGGGDVLMAAETGSGKTGAFCLPVLQIVYEHLYNLKHPPQIKQSESIKMSVYDKSSGFTMDMDGLLCQSADFKAWNGARATAAVSLKQADVMGVYFECVVRSGGICRVGWSSAEASLNLGTDLYGYGFGGTGKKANGGEFLDYGESFQENDCIGVYLNLKDLTIGWSKNGVYIGHAYRLSRSSPIQALYPAVCLKNSRIEVNLGDSAFKYPPVDGFVSFSKLGSQSLVHGSSVAAVKPESKRDSGNSPICLVIEPSRELAEQTYTQFQQFKRHLTDVSIKCFLLIGGTSSRNQIEELYNERAHIVVATPGKLQDFINQGVLELGKVKFFVLDEADGLLSAGYSDMIAMIHSRIPQYSSDGRASRLQMIVCSATLHNFDVKKMADKLMHFPTWIDLKGQDSVPETVHHCVCMVDPISDGVWRNRNSAEVGLVQTDGVHHHHQGGRANFTSGDSDETLSEGVKILKFTQPMDRNVRGGVSRHSDPCIYAAKVIAKFKMDRCLIFCRTKVDCDNLERLFTSLGGGPRQSGQYSCVCLHSDRSPQERKSNLQKFKDQQVRLMICTDVAARGIDINGLPFVINVTLPDEKSNYIHRIGRVGRAERMGLAVSLCSTVPEKVWYHSCPSKGKSCNNTRLVPEGGCSIWYTEKKYLADIEEHLGETIQNVDNTFNVPVDQFQGKVVYGRKIDPSKKQLYRGHIGQIAPVVKSLEQLERKSQQLFLQLKLKVNG